MQAVKAEYFDDFMLFADDLLSANKIKVFEFGSFHREMMSLILRNRYVAVMLPVGHLKTTLVSICYPLWRLLTQQDYEICLVSSTLDQSKKILSQIQQFLSNTPWLQHLVPNDRSYSWNKYQLLTTNNNSLYIRPFNPSARGIQPNEIIYDDIVRESDISMEQIKDTFWHVFFPRGQTKECKHILVGTPVSSDDLLFEIKEKAEKQGTWAFITYPAILSDEKGNSKPLWPERFPLSELNEIKRNMGEYRFNQEYMCSPSAAGEGFFPRHYVLNACDDSLCFDYSTQGVVTIGADFAMSDAPTGDYNVFTVVDSISGEITRKVKVGAETIELKVNKPVIIKRIERYRGSTGQVRRLKELAAAYKAVRVIVDSSTFGQRFAQELRELGISVDAQDFYRANRNQLLINLRRLFEPDEVNNSPARLIIPTSQKDGTFNVTKHLIRELDGFIETKTKSGLSTLASTLEHDDTVFSLALAVKDVGYSRATPKKLVYSAKPVQSINI